MDFKIGKRVEWETDDRWGLERHTGVVISFDSDIVCLQELPIRARNNDKIVWLERNSTNWKH